MDPNKARAAGSLRVEDFEYTFKDVIFYALSVGAKLPEDFNYLYENAENFMVLPTFVVVPGLLASAAVSSWPGIEFDLTRVLHGEQFVELYEEIPTHGKMQSEVEVVDILDKGSAAVILVNVTTYDAVSRHKIAVQQFAMFQKGAGQFGGNRSSSAEIPCIPIPEGPPDSVYEMQTSSEQAAFYRLSSMDLNPLHIDPDFAKSANYQTPIMHGLCTLGFSIHSIIRRYANNDASGLKAIKVRFAGPVYPGQQLRAEMWKRGNRIHFQTKIKETEEVVLASGYCDLKLEGKDSPSSELQVPTESTPKSKL